MAAKDAKEARRVAKKGAADEAAGAQAVAAVDAAVEDARSKRLQALVVLNNLPPCRSVIVTIAPKPVRPPDPVHPRPPNPVKIAEQALAAAEAAKVSVEELHRAAQRALARLQPPMFGGEKLTSRSWRCFYNLPLEMPHEELHLQRRRALQDALLAAEGEVSQAHFGVEMAARDIRSARDELSLEQQFAEQDKQAQAEWARQLHARTQARLEAERLEAEWPEAEEERHRVELAEIEAEMLEGLWHASG